MSTTQGIDFARLTLKDALDLATLIEEEARERYEELADQMELHHTPEAAKFFRFMASNEEKHRVVLLTRRTERFRDAPVAVKRNMLFDVEAPDYDEARAFMTQRQALNVAMRAEKKAYEFFVAALPRIADEDVKALFQELRDEEIEHQELVQKELAKAPPDPDLPSDDFADEPVAQG
jgi:erythrin-vacuolar iron transport family protein